MTTEERSHGRQSHGTSPHGGTQTFHLGAGAVAGAGGLTATLSQLSVVPATTALSSAGSVAASAVRARAGTSSQSGAGSVAASAISGTRGSTALSGAGSVPSEEYVRLRGGQTSLAGSGQLSTVVFLYTARRVNLVSAALEVYDVDNHGDTPDDTVEDVFLSFEMDSILHDAKDEGEITVDDPTGALDDILTIGKRVTLNVETAENPNHPIRYTTMIGPREIERVTPTRAVISCELEDFVGGILSARRIDGAYTDDQVNDVVEDIHRQKFADEVDLDLDDTDDTQVDEFYRQAITWEAVTELADRADMVVATDGTTLSTRRIDAIDESFELSHTDLSLPYTVRENPDGLFNIIRVDSGESDTVEQANDVQDGTMRVDDENRAYIRVRTRKSAVSRVDLWTDPDAGDTDDLAIRIQAGVDPDLPAAADPENPGAGEDAPVDIFNPDSDVARRTLAEEFLAQDGYTSFFIPEHTLPDRNPWLIIESQGDGQVIGTGGGVPTYQSYYPYPLNASLRDVESIAEYREREKNYEKENLNTFDAVQGWSEAKLARNSQPDRVFSFPAESERAARLKPGERISVALDDESVDGDYLVTSVGVEADAEENSLRLSTTVEAQEIPTL